MSAQHLLIVGAGLSGAVLARELAEAGHRISVVEARAHVAGNCHTARDPETGIMVHVYGPHIFHTDDAEVWAYVNRWAEFMPYVHRVKTTTGGRVYSLPVNLHTINQFFDQALAPAAARAFIARRATQLPHPPRNFEEQALHLIGPELYEAFFKGYTHKQWGRAPTTLPATLLRRLPLRFNYDDNYYAHRFQGLPREGYTALTARLLDHPAITAQLNRRLGRSDTQGHDHVFWTGPLDAWFAHRHGRLGYRTLDFARSTHEGDFQGCAVMNYGDSAVPWTRITEHKHLAPWEDHARSIIYHETARACAPDDIPYYPIRLAAEKRVLTTYLAAARAEAGVSFVGRLGTYRYLDMDQTIREALDLARSYQHHTQTGAPMPVFAG